MNTYFVRLLIVISFIYPVQSLAHGEAAEDLFEKVHQYGTVMERLGSLSFGGEAFDVKPGTPYIRTKEGKLYLDSGFYALAEEIARLYIEEIKGACPQCEVPTKEFIEQEAREIVGKSALRHTGESLSERLLMRYGLEALYLGARYGRLAFALKVAGEIAEDALLYVLQMPEMHFLCEGITLAIARMSGPINTFRNTLRYARHFETGSLRQVSRLWATSFLAKRAFRRMQLAVGPIELNPIYKSGEKVRTERQHVIEEELESNKKIARHIQRLERAADLFYPRVEKLLEERSTASEKRAQAIDAEIESLRDKISKETKVSRKVFEGRRYGTSPWWILPHMMTKFLTVPLQLVVMVKKRGGRNALNGSKSHLNQSGINRLYRGTKIWMLPYTSSLIQPAFQLRSDMKGSLELYRTDIETHRNQLAENDISRILMADAKEAGIDPENMSKLFADIQSLFETQTSRRRRYIRLILMEAFLSHVMPKIIKSYVINVTQEFSRNNPKELIAKRRVALITAAGKAAYLSDMYMDYLRNVTLTKGRSLGVFEKAMAQDYLTNLWGLFQTLQNLRGNIGPETMDRVIRDLQATNEKLEARQFWMDNKGQGKSVKNLAVQLLTLGKVRNVFRPRLSCSKLYYQ